jgi:dihydroorotate dehydrogenase (NAD+) catalytic subunit
MKTLFGYPILSPFGIAACPSTTSQGIARLAKKDYGVFVYKTIRSRASPIYSSQIYPVVDDAGKMGITNAYGMNSLEPEQSAMDIASSRSALRNGQVLIVSVYGDDVEDFVLASRIARKGGAQAIEANLSCPNVFKLDTVHTCVYERPNEVYDVCKAITNDLSKDVPLIVKVGSKCVRETIVAASRGGARGICGINSVPTKVVDASGNPAYGADKTITGLSGAPLRPLALKFAAFARKTIEDENLNLVLFVVGGVTRKEHFYALLKAGADVALTATGAMFDNKSLY